MLFMGHCATVCNNIGQPVLLAGLDLQINLHKVDATEQHTLPEGNTVENDTFCFVHRAFEARWVEN